MSTSTVRVSLGITRISRGLLVQLGKLSASTVVGIDGMMNAVIILDSGSIWCRGDSSNGQCLSQTANEWTLVWHCPLIMSSLKTLV